MNKNLKYLGFLAVLPLLTVALTTDYIGEADALKSKGTYTSQYGSATANKVCGDRLCSETGGKVIMPSGPAEPEDGADFKVTVLVVTSTSLGLAFFLGELWRSLPSPAAVGSSSSDISSGSWKFSESGWRSRTSS